MAKLTRYLQKIFANNSNQVGVFGTGTDKVASKNVETLQSSDYEDGWSSAIITNKNYPIWQERDGVDYGFSYQLAYLMQNGIPEWLSTETYYANTSFCQYGGKIYQSLQDNNTNHNPALNDGYWTEFSSGASRNIGEIVTSTIPLEDAGLHLLDGTLLQYGSYQAFVDYIANIYNTTKTYNSSAFTAVGSPTISTDGILNVSVTNNGIKILTNLTENDNFKIEFEALSPAGISTNNGTSSTLLSNISNSSSGDLKIYWSYWGFNVSLGGVGTGNVLQQSLSANTWYNIILEYDGNGNYEFKCKKKSDTNWTSSGTKTGVSFNTITELFSNYISGNTGTWANDSYSIDLNTFKIYIDDEIVLSGIKADGFCLEYEWQQSVTNYGVCGKFVYDNVNQTVRLPKITGFIEGTTDVTALGDLVEAGLPNITGWIKAAITENGSPDAGGAFNINHNYDSSDKVGTANWTSKGVDFDASRSSSIYGNSSTVQPQSVKVLYYIVIATSTKTSIQVDIDEIATDLNGKADVDLTNVNNSGTSKSVEWTMPSSTYVNLTLGATGATYTAPANGWVSLSKVAGSSQKYVGISVTNKMSVQSHSSNTNDWLEIYMPVAKDDVFTVGYDATGTTRWFKFYYAKGSESEA